MSFKRVIETHLFIMLSKVHGIYLHKTDPNQGHLTVSFYKQLICSELHHFLVAWTKMKTTSLITICVMVVSSQGLPDKYQSTMVRGVQDKALRKFYHELYGQQEEKKKQKTIEDFLSGNDTDEKKGTEVHNIKQEKRKPRTIQFVTESPISRSVEKKQADIPTPANGRDPTFVFSKLLFHLSQLP